MLSARIALIVLIALACTAHASHAQLRAELPGNYPTKPVRIIVGSVPGGGERLPSLTHRGRAHPEVFGQVTDGWQPFTRE